MNYGKKSTQKKRAKLTSASSRMGNKAGVTALRVLFLSIAAVCVIITCMGVGAFRAIIDNAPDISDVNIMPIGNATFVYDADGNMLQKLSAPTANRMSVSIDKIPLDMQHAIVAIEDERFYEHNGIDVRGILRAFVNGVARGFKFNEGASTLTQQLLKNNVFTNWTNEGKIERFTRKFQEQYLALQLEASLTAEGMDAKSVILENYLNTINLSAGTYGVQAAAQRYFGKNSEDLTLSECAVLAAIPQNPYAFNPIRHPEKNAERRKKVLRNMLEQGYITQEEHDEALADNVYERIKETDSTQQTAEPYSYFTDELTSQLINDFQTQLGYTKVQAQNALYSGGLSIYTTQDPDIQAILDEEYQNEENFPSSIQLGLDWALTVEKADGTTQNYSKEMMRLYFRDHEDDQFDLLFDSEEEAQSYVDKYKAAVVAEGDKIVAERMSFSPQPQSSMVIIDQHTGYVKAIVGGRGEKTASLTLNRATDTTRQPGSTFKIVSTYAPALNEKGMTLATTFEDEPYNYPDGSPVENASRSYSGTTTIRKAIQSSINVVAVKCLEEVTPELGLQYLDNFGFTTLAHGTEADTDEDGTVWTDANLPMALGGLTHGVTNIELCAAYAAIANQGNYIEPLYYTKILDHDGNVLIEKNSAGRSVIKESTAWLLTSAMEDVINYGTGTACQLDNMTVAGKTGTTDDYNDLWFAGYTPYYTCTVWSGFDNNEKLPDDYSREFHKNLWKKVMTRIHEGLENKDFEMPSTVEKVSICADTGLLPRAGCSVITEYFDIGDVPTEYCDQHFYEPEPIPEYIYDETEIPEPTVVPEDPNTEDPNAGGNTEDPNAGGNTEDPNAGGDGGGDNGGGDGSGNGSGDGSGGDWNEGEWEVYYPQ